IQPRLALDADVDAERVGAVEDRPNRLGELVRRLVRRHPAETAAAGDADVGGAEVPGELERPQDQLGAVAAVFRVGADQARLEVRLWRRVLPVAKTAVA